MLFGGALKWPAAVWSQWVEMHSRKVRSSQKEGKGSPILYLEQDTGMPQGGRKEKEGLGGVSQHLVSSQRESLGDGAHTPNLTILIPITPLQGPSALAQITSCSPACLGPWSCTTAVEASQAAVPALPRRALRRQGPLRQILFTSRGVLGNSLQEVSAQECRMKMCEAVCQGQPHTTLVFQEAFPD